MALKTDIEQVQGMVDLEVARMGWGATDNDHWQFRTKALVKQENRHSLVAKPFVIVFQKKSTNAFMLPLSAGGVPNPDEQHLRHAEQAWYLR
jgi:hypothetical protein